jgi:two-component system, NarL family, response regulator DesR
MPTQRGAIGVLLVHREPVVRAELARALEAVSDIDVIALVDGGREALSLIAGPPPDVALVELALPDREGAALIARAFPTTRIVTCGPLRLVRLRTALEAGALGHLPHDVQPDDLARAVRAAAAGERLPPVPTRRTAADPTASLLRRLRFRR